jgi:hypothetical protein
MPKQVAIALLKNDLASVKKLFEREATNSASSRKVRHSRGFNISNTPFPIFSGWFRGTIRHRRFGHPRRSRQYPHLRRCLRCFGRCYPCSTELLKGYLSLHFCSFYFIAGKIFVMRSYAWLPKLKSPWRLEPSEQPRKWSVAICCFFP